MSSTIFELSGPGDSRPRPDDLFVKALSVQGGEANIGGESTPFARIVMTGVELKHATADPHALRRQEGVVLKLEHAAAFAAELRRILNGMVRASRTPTVPSSGIWSWTSVPPAAEDMMVAQVTASGTAVALVAGPTPTVRVDFLGTLVHGLTSSKPRAARARARSSQVPGRCNRSSAACARWWTRRSRDNGATPTWRRGARQTASGC